MLIQLKKIRRDLSGSKDGCMRMGKVLALLECICKILFYLSDHLVVLGQLAIVPQGFAAKYESRSMLMYLLQNVFGVVKNLV